MGSLMAGDTRYPEGLVRDLLLEHDCVTNVTVQSGAVVQPEGDLIECDVAREQAEPVLRQLEGLGLGERGGIVILTPSGTPFATARMVCPQSAPKSVPSWSPQ